MTADEFQGYLNAMNLTQRAAARVLRVSSQQRVSDWATGKRPVPEYIAAHVKTLAKLRSLTGGEP